MSEQLPSEERLARLKHYYNPDVSPKPGNTAVKLAEEVAGAIISREGFDYQPSYKRRERQITKDIMEFGLPIGVWGLLFETMMMTGNDTLLSAVFGLIGGTLAYTAVHHALQENTRAPEV